MSSASKSLMAQVAYNGQKMAMVDAWSLLDALPPNFPLTTSEAASFLRMSASTLERTRQAGTGPVYSQAGGFGAKGTNQKCLYLKKDLVDWRDANTVSSSMQAAIRKGQTFATLTDLAEERPFYVDAKGAIESAVEENLLGTVVERLGQWDIVWLNAVDAASRQWTNRDTHSAFAEGVKAILSQSQQSIASGLDATDIASVANEPPAPPVIA